jgi:uncharacterized protein YifE (UPF0438 family)
MVILMTRISRTSRTKAERVQAAYVNRLTEVHSVDPIQPIKRTEQIKNHTSHPSENHLLSYERYFQTKQHIRDAFRHFYRHEKELCSIANGLDEASKEILTHIEKLVQKYNQTMKSLKSFDKLSGTNHLLSIEDLVLQHKCDLKTLGITVQHSSPFLSFDPAQFLIHLAKSKTTTLQQVKSFKTLIMNKYQSLAQTKIIIISQLL